MISKLFSASVVLLIALAGCASGPSVGCQAPSVTTGDSQANDISITAFQDQVLILDFWAVW